jgi:predicted  nucleic acid-binding Zn-ribbon protein
VDVAETTKQERPKVVLLESVRCLSCGAVYSKPNGVDIVAANPGCPRCGYLGWLATSSATALALRYRFAGDRRRLHSA